MTPEEEAYEEALRRIREAEATGAVELDLSGRKWEAGAWKFTELETLNRLPPELANLTSLQSLDLSGCGHLSGDLSPLAGLSSLHSLNLSWCRQLRDDMSPLARLTSLQSLNLSYCGFRRFASVKSLLRTLKELYLAGCKFDDLPSEICGENQDKNVLHKVRAHYHTLRQIFVSYAGGNISPNATEEDRQREEVVERLCRKLEQERWNLIRDKGALDYGDQISDFMKTLGQARLVIVVLSEKYLRSTACMTELYDIYKNAQQQKAEFLNRIIPLVLQDANIGNWRGRAAYAEHWETEFKAMEQHLTRLGEDDLKLYRAMRRWHNEVGDMLAYVNDKLVPHGFDEIVKDDFAGLRQMLQRRETSQVAMELTERMATSGLDIQSLVTAQRKLSDLPQAIELEIRSLLKSLQSHVLAQQQTAPKSADLDPATILALAKGLLAEQKWVEAGMEFERYARYKPDDWEASYGRGVAFANARGGNSTNLSALRACNDAITYAPQNANSPLQARLFAYRGAILKRLNRLNEAEADLNIAQRYAIADYERMDVAYNLACVYALTHRRDEMLNQIRLIGGSPRYLNAVLAHLDDYFATYKNDPDLLKLIEVH
jgi:Leucine-rich repeat (LRR) protein